MWKYPEPSRCRILPDTHGSCSRDVDFNLVDDFSITAGMVVFRKQNFRKEMYRVQSPMPVGGNVFHGMEHRDRTGADPAIRSPVPAGGGKGLPGNVFVKYCRGTGSQAQYLPA